MSLFTIAGTRTGQVSSDNGTTPVQPFAEVVVGNTDISETGTATSGSGSFGAGRSISFSLGLSQPVTVAGTPVLLLNDGGTAAYASGSGSGTLVFTTTVAPGQNAAPLAVTGALLPAGSTIRNAAGIDADVSGVAAIFAGLVVDTTPPAVTVALANDTSSVTGSNGTTRDATLSGTGEAGGTVTVREGGTVLGTAPVQADGNWTFAPALTAGAHTLVASEADAAGNVGSAALGFRLDQPPVLVGTVAGQAVADTGTLRPFSAVTLSDPDEGAFFAAKITLFDASGAATDTNGTLSGIGLRLTGVGTYAFLRPIDTARGAAALATLVFTPRAGQAPPGGTVTTRFALAVSDDQGAEAVDVTTTVVATGGLRPFATVSVSSPDPAATVTVSAQLRPATSGSYGNLGYGTLSSDGQTYTVSGRVAAVNAALAGVVFTPATGQPVPTGTVAGLVESSSGARLVDTNPAGDVLLGGASSVSCTVTGGAGNNVFFGRVGPTRIEGGPGHDTVSAPVCDVTVVSGTGGSVIGLGSGTALVNAQGPDTVIAGSGAATLGVAAGSLVSLGTGPAVVSAASGSTVVGGAGADTVGVRGDGIVFFAGSGQSLFISGTGVSTVVAGTGSQTIFGGAGGGVYAGGSAGRNVIVAGEGATTMFGGGDGDVLFATGSAGTVLVAGAGNETLQGIGSSGADVFFAGSGSTLIGLGFGADTVFAGTGSSTVVAGPGRDLFAFVNGRAGGVDSIVGFKVGTDQFSLQGYAAGEINRALASASTTSGTGTTAASTTLTLADNTRIVFQGLSSVDARLFG